MCEFGAVPCTLLYLFNLKYSRNAGYSGTDADVAQKSISFTFLSLPITIVTATVKTIGVSRVLKAVRSAAVSVRSSMAVALGPSQVFAPHSGVIKPSCDQDEEGKDQSTDPEDDGKCHRCAPYLRPRTRWTCASE